VVELVEEDYLEAEEDINMKKNKRRKPRKLWAGGRINRGSGKIDRNSGPNRFTVDDVNGNIRETGEPIIVGRDEYIINSRTAKKLGYDFLDKLNQTGLVEGGGFGKGSLPGSNYQDGGRVRRNNITDCRGKLVRGRKPNGDPIC